MILALFLGIAVAVLAITAVVLVKTADDARDEAAAAAGTTDHSSHAAESSAVSLPLQSFAGTTGENAEELAMAHQATSAVLPPVPAGGLVKVRHDPEGHGRRDRAGREVQHLGVRRARRPGACRARA